VFCLSFQVFVQLLWSNKSYKNEDNMFTLLRLE